MNAIPTHDGNWIARRPATGLTASGRTKENALENLQRLIERTEK